MDECDFSGSGARLAVSVVLFKTARPLLEGLVSTLAKALGSACAEGTLKTVVILTDHSPTPLPEDWRAGLQRLLAPSMRLDYRHAGENPGFGAGHNQAFGRGAGAEYFLVANPDIEFAPGSLAAGLAFLDVHPELGLLSPALIEPDGGRRPACFRYPDLPTLLARAGGGQWARRRSFRYECRDWDPDAIRSPLLSSGCCMLFRAAAFARLGGFDPGYFLYFEDYDLSLRAGRHGLAAYFPGMAIVHRGGGAARKGLRHAVLFVHSAVRFFSKHGWLAPGSGETK